MIPEMIHIALTGLKSGIGAKRILPAAASAPKVAVGTICRKVGLSLSKLNMNKNRARIDVTSVRRAEFSRSSSAQTIRIAGTANKVMSSMTLLVKLFLVSINFTKIA